MSTSINSILYQFLHDRGWTLDNLTSCNLIGYGIRKQLYHITHDAPPFLFNFCIGASLRLISFNSCPAFLGRQLKISSLLRGRI